MREKIKLGVSTCLLGESVRYDGSHKRDRFITDTLAHYVELVPVCPEVECGLSIPREAMRLVGDEDNPRLVTRKTGIDYTDKMRRWARSRLRELEKENLRGFIFKSQSPSSGMERVKVYNDTGMARKTGVGVFAQAFMKHFPLVPVEEEGRLHDMNLRENFIQRLFAYDRWHRTRRHRPGGAGLMEFHSRHKLMLMAHEVKAVSELGRMIAEFKGESVDKIADAYIERFMSALAKQATRARNTNVLMHVLGYFKKLLTADEKQESLELIEQYRQGHLPLIVPITLLNHYVRKYDQPYLREQQYLNPGPWELQLRNHA